MFGRKNKILGEIDTLIGANTVITGDIQFSGGLRVDGRVCGSITVTGNKKNAVLILSSQGSIEGKVRVPHIVIDGTVDGPIHADENLELQSGAKITGDIHYKTIKMHQGATVEGKMVRLESSQPEKLITFVANPSEQNQSTEITD